MEKRPFSDFSLSSSINKAIDALGYELASPVQSAALPPLLEGRDLVGQSPTGSGKTAAFGIPLVERLDPSKRCVQALIICPTRELAVQVAGELHKLVSFMTGVKVLPVYGGASFERQADALKRGTQIVIGTPGRMLDHLRRGTLKLGEAKTAVLDEADEMLDMGFREDIEAILSELPTKRQMVLFSATMPRAIRELTEKFTEDPVKVTVAHEMQNAPDIEQIYYEVRFRSKPEVLSRLLDTHSSKLTIVFCNTKRTVDDVTEDLGARGFSVDRLHGDVTQHVRTRVMNAFRNASINVLVATDVAARGIDVDDVELVLNYDLPFDAEDYVHRIGRTGRAGRSGKAISMVAGKDVYKLQTIQRHTKQKVTRFKVPTLDELVEHRTDRFYSQLRDLLADGTFDKQTRIIDRLLDQGFSPTEVTAATLHLLVESEGRTAETIPEDRPKGERFQKGKHAADKIERPAGHERRRDASPGDMARLFVNIGNLMKVSPGDLAGVLYNAGGFPQGSLGKITVFAKHSIIEVPQDALAPGLQALRDVKVRGKDVNFKEDQRPESDSYDSGERGGRSERGAKRPWNSGGSRSGGRDQAERPRGGGGFKGRFGSGSGGGSKPRRDRKFGGGRKHSDS
jgi:ATP-dependent RNA helicase DeaD